MSRRGRSVLLLCLIAALAACRGGTTERGLGRLPSGLSPQSLNVLLITLDTTRADHLGAYGGPPGLTPNLDAFAARSTRFTRAASVMPLTLGAHSTIMTGLLPAAHGVRDNGGYRLAAERKTLAEAFAAAGASTGGFVSAYVLDHKWGISQGFERYFDDFDLSEAKSLSLGEIQRRGDETVDQALAWLAAQSGQRFFAWVHLYDPHTPYQAPEPFKSRYPGSPYKAEIAWTDSLVGQLLDFLKQHDLERHTLVAVLADHGESFGDHGETGHGYFLYAPTTHVPFLLAGPYPGLAGRTVDAAVGQADVAPTLLELAGLPAAALEPGHGRSLVPLLSGRPDPPGALPRAYSESFVPRLHFGWAELRGLRSERWHFIEAPRPELYDLDADPGETRNVAADDRRVLADMRRQLAALDAATQAAPARAEPVEEDEETARKLAALGYLGSAAPASDKSFRDLPDPKDKLRVYNLIARARDMARSEEPAKAIPLFEEILAEDPEVSDAWFALGNVYFRTRDWERAAENYQKTLRLRPDHDWAMIGLADTFVARGRPADAIAGYRKYLAGDPDNAQVLYRLAQVLLDTGQDREAGEAFGAVLAAEPATARAEVGRSVVLFRGGDLPGAHAALDRALRIDPKAKFARYNRALLFEAENKPGAAEAAYREEIADHAGEYKALFNLGRLLARQGQAREAATALGGAVEANPEFAPGRLFLAQALLGLGDFERAESEARKGLAQDPDSRVSALGHYVLADILNRRGDSAAAAREAALGRAIQQRAPREPPAP
jgi:arylsulfatase A-like enzyme/Tfp pilus assembly protein PilF